MKRKYFTFTLVLLLCCFMATSAWAAKKIDLLSTNSQGYIEKMNNQGDKGHTAMGEILGLAGDEKFTFTRQTKDFNDVTHARYVQSYKDIPVWGHEVVVSRDHTDQVVKLDGTVVLDAKGEIKNIPGALDPKAALKRMQEDHKKKDAKASWFFTNEKYGTYIYIDKKNKANLCYVVSFFADNETGNPSRPCFFINARTGKVIDSFNMLTTGDGTGPGGNAKIGQYEYGTNYPGFGVTVGGSTCTMNTTNVKTVDLNHGTSGSTAYSYTCYRNTHETINGGYCPLNDGQYFGQVIYDMYQNWYGLPVLPFQLTMKLHYSNNYENAFWDGSSMTFGDGASTFYPLCCLDVAAHEVSHGFTENHSNLTYSGQSGGMNESYSDMAGEAAKYYMRGTNDFMCGYDIFKAAGEALRYLYDPPLDGVSIDHVSEYSGQDVHYTSGIYNKAFYLIAVSSGWNTRMAFDIFTKANTDYWTASETFQSGGEDVLQAALDYAYPCSAVVTAFAAVGVNVSCPQPPVANFTGTPLTGGAPLTVNFTDTSTNSPTSWSWNFGDGGTSTVRNPSHQYASQGVYTVTLTATNSSGSDGETKTNYITVTPPAAPVANFSASTTNPTVGTNVTFTDTSINTPTSWSWTFAGGTPATSTAQNPTVTYNTIGTYDVSLTAANAQGSDIETKVGYITVSAVPYCASQGTTYSMEWIARVQVGGTIDNSSGSAGYTDFTNITGNLTGGYVANVTLTPGFSGSTYTEYWKIWIDYNGDHDFLDAGEEEFSGSGTSTVTGTFTVNTGVDIVTRMRVSMKYNAAPTSCETFSYGEVEDYTVDISVGTPQPPVAAFTASSTTVAVGGSVTFTDQSTNAPTSWSWTFEGGTPATSTAQNPVVTYNTVGTYDVTLTAANASGSDQELKVDYITVTSAPTDEIAEGVDYTSTFTKSGNANWTKVTDVYYYGGDSAKSGAISHSQSTTIETSVTVGTTQAVKFYWKVSSESGYDYLRFYIDGVQKNQISGTVDWTQVAYNITAGTHTLKWTYIKDGSVVSGSDCGWVDKLEITTPVADPIAEAVDYPGLTFTLSGTGNWFSQTTTTYYGGDAAQSADIGNNQTTTMETNISGVTSVKFYWKVSSEANYDYLKFYIDGVEQAKIAGTVNWTQKTYTVTSGAHTLKWSFIKDAYVSSGSDCGWVDKLELQ